MYYVYTYIYIYMYIYTYIYVNVQGLECARTVSWLSMSVVTTRGSRFAPT